MAYYFGSRGHLGWACTLRFILACTPRGILVCLLTGITLSENQPPCPRNQYVDSRRVCQPCNVCPPGEELRQACTNQSDTICRSCDVGSFSSGTRECMKCTRCRPGTFVMINCTESVDTVCKACIVGTYSSDWSASSCTPCRKCLAYQTVSSKCSLTGNYRCGSCIEGYYMHPNLPVCMRCSRNSVHPSCPTSGELLYFAGAPQSRSKSPPSTSTPAPITGRERSRPSPVSEPTSGPLLPPHVSIPIIATSVVLIAITFIAILVYNRTRIARMCKCCPCTGGKALLNVSFIHDRKSLSDGSLDRANIPGFLCDETNRHVFLEHTHDDVPAFSCNHFLLQFSPQEANVEEPYLAVTHKNTPHNQIQSVDEGVDVLGKRISHLHATVTNLEPENDALQTVASREGIRGHFDDEVQDRLSGANSSDNVFTPASTDVDVPSCATDNTLSLWAYNIAFIEDEDFGQGISLLGDSALVDENQHLDGLGRRTAWDTKEDNYFRSDVLDDPATEKNSLLLGIAKQIHVTQGEPDTENQDVFEDLETTDGESTSCRDNGSEVEITPSANTRMDSGIADCDNPQFLTT